MVFLMTVTVRCLDFGWRDVHSSLHGLLLWRHSAVMSLVDLTLLMILSLNIKLLKWSLLRGKVLIIIQRIIFALYPHASLADNFSLKLVRRAIWDIRSQWKDLGIELDMDIGTLKVLYNSHSCYL